MAQGNANPQKAIDYLPTFLVVCNVVGIGITYSITILLARHLTHASFEQYIGTLATLGMLAALGEAGFGKYALKIVPVYVATGSIDLLAGYLRFGLVGCLALSLLLGMLASAVEIPLQGNAGRVLLIAMFFLPAMAGFGVAVDMLLAFRMATSATILARIAVPLTTLALVLLVIRTSVITPYLALLCFCGGSLFGMLAAFGLCLGKTRPLVRGGVPRILFREWTLHGFSFLVFAFLTSWIFKAPLVLLHYLPHQANELAMLAPAFETGSLVLLISKSTDKYFQPTMSMIIESRNWDYGKMLRRQRFWIVGSGIVVFLAVVFFWGRPILSLYGADFVAAYPALCLIAIGSSCWTLFSLAPSFLLFVGEYRALVIILFVHGILLTLLTTILFGYYGVTGAASAYAITLASLSLTNLRHAQRRLVARTRKLSPASECGGLDAHGQY